MGVHIWARLFLHEENEETCGRERRPLLKPAVYTVVAGRKGKTGRRWGGDRQAWAGSVYISVMPLAT
jgi:hypothetical protein